MLARLGCILVAAGTAACLTLAAQQLVVRATPDQIHVTTPKFHFLAGKPLELLKNGNTVAFDFHLAVLAEGKDRILRRSFERFVFSYDIWEERFSVSRLRGQRSSASRLSAQAAEAWCLDNITVASSGIPADRPVWVRLDIRAQEDREERPVGEDETLSLANLIDIFSRPGKQEPNQWRLEAGPLLLRDLRVAPGRMAF
jgi:hypothetical protein